VKKRWEREALTAALAAGLLASCQAKVVPDPVSAGGTVSVCDGVVYATTQIGNRIYIGGDFRTVGTDCGNASTLVTRPFLVAVDAASGALDPGFQPAPNALVRALAPSSDGKLLSGGRHSSFGGTAASALAKLDPASGALVSGFSPQVRNGDVRSIAVTSSRTYIAGDFTSVDGTIRPNVAAVENDGSLDTTLHPVLVNATDAVRARSVAVGGGRLYLAGEFSSVNGTTRYNFASFSLSTGSLTSWNPDVRARGWDVALSPDASMAYVTTADGTSGTCSGEHEAVLALPTNVSGVPPRRWTSTIAPFCLWHTGDVNTVAANSNFVFIGGHLAELGEGGSLLRPSLAALRASDGAVLPFEPNGAGGAFGVLDLAITPSGLLAGGDFLTMGGTPRPRFARFGIGADAHGPTRPAAPRVVERTPGTLSVSWDGARDTTDLNITYRVLRDGAETPVFTTLGPGVPALRYSFVDTSVAVGEQHRYRVVVDDGGFTATGPDSAPVTVTGATTPYRTQVLGDGPGSYWQLGDPEGSATAADASGRGVHGVVLSGATFGAEGVPQLGPDTALQLSGSAPAVASPSSSVGSNRYSVEAWVKTSDSGGGKFFGFGSSQSEPSEMFDRHVWLGSDGRLSFGNRQSNAIRVVGGSRSPVVNDGRWHHVVATLGYSGMHLYVDGVQVDARTDTKRGQNYEGFWRLGGDKLDGWPGTSGLDRYPSGRLDEVAIYGYELPADAVAGHYRAAVG
jgi:hypothetical protein